MTRQGDLDGRGHLSERALAAFCRFALDCAIDQVEFMAEILDVGRLQVRLERHVDIAEAEGRLPRRAYALVREALMAGEFHRTKAAEITGYKERQARTVLSTLVDAGYLVSDTPRGPVRLGIPPDALEDVFPRLYPAEG